MLMEAPSLWCRTGSSTLPRKGRREWLQGIFFLSRESPAACSSSHPLPGREGPGEGDPGAPQHPIDDGPGTDGWVAKVNG